MAFAIADGPVPSAIICLILAAIDASAISGAVALASASSIAAVPRLPSN